MAKSSASIDTLDPLIDAFIDSLWLEDGLSKLSLAAYRRDLNGLATWLHTQSSSLSAATEPDIQSYFAHRHHDTKASSANSEALEDAIEQASETRANWRMTSRSNS